ncbi:MAG: sulfur oxidation c-type cytochrome SoxX [Alphaproteobacteria bacterium]|nr:sulfur oxidation c-type cytochrome SoxX [Alphaproteobacteria bacterium]
MRTAMLLLAMGLAVVDASTASAQAGPGVVPLQVVGDGIPDPLGGIAGDPARGRAIVVDRQRGLCLLCHTGPFPEQRFQGTLAPSLAGAGARWTIPQLRLRVADSRAIDPATIMPSYHRVDGLARVARAFEGRPILDAQQVEDVVAFLATLQDTDVGMEVKP